MSENDEEVEYSQQAHNQSAGRRSAYQEAHEYILKLAGQRYTEGRDDLARELRESARYLAEKVKIESAELDRHISRSRIARERESKQLSLGKR